MTLSIHCFHRIVPDEKDPSILPYLLRGTALTVEEFERRIELLLETHRIVNEDTAIAIAHGDSIEGAHAWLTFDDGYVDFIEHAAQVLRRFGVPATLFVSTSTLSGATLPADEWYAAVGNARNVRGCFTVDGGTWEFDLRSPHDFARLIDGPERRRYLDSPLENRGVLDELRDQLHPAKSAGRLYLNEDDLRGLKETDFTVGSHSVSHAIFPRSSTETITRELGESSVALSRTLGATPRSFAYPDGQTDARSAKLVRDAGYEIGVGLFDIDAPTPWTLPRVLERRAAPMKKRGP